MAQSWKLAWPGTWLEVSVIIHNNSDSKSSSSKSADGSEGGERRRERSGLYLCKYTKLIQYKFYLIRFCYIVCLMYMCFRRRSQWPRGQRRRSTAARLLRLWVRIPPEAWMSVCCKCCVLSGRCLCDALITPPEESYRMWCVVVCDPEASRMRRSWPALGCRATENICICVCVCVCVCARARALDASAKLLRAAVSFVMSLFPFYMKTFVDMYHADLYWWWNFIQ